MLLTLTGYSQSGREARVGAQIRKLDTETEDEACSVIFRVKPRPTCEGMALPAVAWALRHPLTIKKMPPPIPTGQSDGGNSLTAIFSSWICLGLCQVDKIQPAQ